MHLLLCYVITLVLQVSARSIQKTAAPHHGWQPIEPAPRDGRIRLHIALRQNDNGAQIERQLLEISDPSNASYRKHLEADQIAYLSRPAQGSADAVSSWLLEHGLLTDAVSSFGSILEIDTTVLRAEELLNATYHVYSDGKQNIIRTDRYCVPKGIAEHVDFVTPTTAFPRHSRLKLWSDAFSSQLQPGRLEERAVCGANSVVSPTCVLQVYGIDYTAKPNRTTFGVYGTEAASFNPTDLQAYLQKYNAPAASASPTYQIIGDAGGNDFEAKYEVALDTQTFLGLAWPAQGIFYNLGGVFGPNAGQIFDPFVQFLQELISNETVPSVVSFSESMPEDMMDPAYAKRLCNMMAQVGSRGVSLLFSSGNNGPNGDQPTGNHSKIFEPEFPASCPWVTAVGGTTDLADETAATESTITGLSKAGFTASGGGFSNLFPAPGYQSSVVSKYISSHVPKSYSSASGFNATGRGIPDISAFSTNFPTFVNGVEVPIGGTSASTPLWAAIITLLNDYEASQGRPPLGFLNPWLYSLKSGLKDITTGGNNAGSCGAGCTLPKTLGYNVTEGWDPVTGLGTPMFTELRKALDAANGTSQSGGAGQHGGGSQNGGSDQTGGLSQGGGSNVLAPSWLGLSVLLFVMCFAV